MGKKVSIGVVIALVALTAAVTFTLSYHMAMSTFNKTVADVNERQQMYQKLSEIDQRVRQNYLGTIDESSLSDGISAGSLSGLSDPEGRYLSAEEYKEFLAGASDDSVGIGIETIQDDDGNMEVISVAAGSPAEKEGILKGDVIIRIGGNEVQRIGYGDAVKKLDGALGSTIEIELLRLEEGENTGESLENIQLTVTREVYEYHNIFSELLQGSIGYLRVSQFTAQTVEEFQQEVDNLLEQGVSSLIFDIRNNAGGDVEAVGEILDQLLPAGNLIGTIDKEGKIEFQIQSDANELNIPMAVLVNDGTSGAAELFASAIKDFRKGGIIGETTAGKGTKNKVFPLSDGSAIVISIANYVTMNGQSFTDLGISPNEAVTLEEEQRKLLNRRALDPAADPQLQAAITFLGGTVSPEQEESERSEIDTSSVAEDMEESQ